MGAARRLQRTALATWGTLLALGLLGMACYRPKITAGGFLCADAGTHACPEGFACASDGRCWAPGHDAGSDVRDAGGDADARVDIVDATPDAEVGLPCFDAGTSCDPSDAGVCDPVCQARCGCREKCVVDSTGTAACMMAPSVTLIGIGKPCGNLGVDDCQPGLVCQPDNCGSRCYKYCNSDLDCPNSTCSRAGGGSYMVCDVPFADCDPIGSSSNTCVATSLGCYVSARTVDKTLCDCIGSGLVTDPCTSSRDCFPGLVCVNLQCQQTCRLDGTGTPQCPGGASHCSRYLNNTSTVFGYCF